MDQGRCDFKFKTRIEQVPSVALNDWLSNDVFVKLHKSQPRVVDKKLEDETTVKVIELGADGLPIIDQSVVGVSRSVMALMFVGDAFGDVEDCIR